MMLCVFAGVRVNVHHVYRSMNSAINSRHFLHFDTSPNVIFSLPVASTYLAKGRIASGVESRVGMEVALLPSRRMRPFLA